MFVREARAGTEAETAVRAHVSRPSLPQREKENETRGAHRSTRKEEQGQGLESPRGRLGFCAATLRALQTSEGHLALGSTRRRSHTVEGRGKRHEDAVTYREGTLSVPPLTTTHLYSSVSLVLSMCPRHIPVPKTRATPCST